MIDLPSLIESNGLEFNAIPAASNPLMPQESADLSHWFCTLSGDAISGFDFYVSLGADYEGREPSLEFALSLLIEDVRSYRGCEGYEDFARLLGIDDGDPEGDALCFAAYEELSRLSPLIDEVLDLEITTPAAAV